MKAAITRSILEILKQCEPYALPERSLYNQVCIALRPPPDEKDFPELLISLRAKKFIDYILDDMDESVRKWHITESGKTLLQK